MRQIRAEAGGAPFPPDTGVRLSLRSGEPAALLWGRDGHSFLDDPVNTTLSRAAGRTRVIRLDVQSGLILELDGRGAAPWRVKELSGVDAAGIAHDPERDALFVLDREGDRILRVAPLGPGPTARRVDSIPLPEGLPPLHGLAFDPASGHLHVLAPETRELIELGPDGTLLANRVLPAEIGEPRAIAFGPSRDTTDDPGTTTLFVASATKGGGSTAELSLSAAVLAAAGTETPTLLQTVLTSQFSPPSPDPSGIDLIEPSASAPLLVSDGEVNEMSIYTGVNLFDVSPGGSLVGTSDTLSFSNEPAGVAVNWTNGHFFFTDDTGTRAVYEVSPGANQRVDASDPVREIPTAGFGSQDPEGAAFGGGALFVVDGVNAEVYRLAPGPNGSIDGGGDDVITHFDTAGFGVIDPEGLAYDSDAGQLYVVGEPADRIAHVTTDGTLLRWLDTSAANARSPAGLAYGPGPAGSRRLYAVDRGVDNNSDPNENDGKLYVFEVVPLGGSGGNLPPSVSISAPSSVDIAQAATLVGSASDDGLPAPPQLTATWSQQSGPGTADFDDANAAETTATFSAGGSYVLRLTAFDGELAAWAEATISVIDPNGPQTLERRVSSSSDDAEEKPTGGSVRLTSSDLELVTDGASVQTVGMRFTNLTIPAGASIQNAWIQFQVDEETSTATALLLRGQLAANAAPFLSSTGNVSSRPTTQASVNWSPTAWPIRGDAGAAQRTPPLAAIVQEIVSNGGWASGNAMAFVISGSGERVAEAFDGDASGAPLLHVEYLAGTVPTTTTTSSTTTTTTSTTSSTAPTTTTTTSTTSSTAPTTTTTSTTSSTAPTTTTTTSTTSSTAPTTTTTSTTSSTAPTTTTTSTTSSTTSSTTTTSTTLPPIPPTVAILSPATGSEIREGDPILFSGTANDPVEGDLGAGLAWSSDLDGPIGSAASFSYAGLSKGLHRITASVSDGEGATGSDEITVLVDASGAPPGVAILSPASDSVFSQTAQILFTGSANDPETGDVSASLVWTSHREGVIGSGPGFSLSGLSRGKHTITATATDPGGKPGSAAISIHVRH